MRSLLFYFQNVEYEGVTGLIHFDLNGFRTEVQLHLIEKHLAKMHKTAIWTPDAGINYTQTAQEVEAMNVEKLQNKTLRISTHTTVPYIIKKPLPKGTPPEAEERMSFEEKFEGYVVDLVKHLSAELKFKYKFHLVGDKQYGKPDPVTGEWNGMIRELLDK